MSSCSAHLLPCVVAEAALCGVADCDDESQLVTNCPATMPAGGARVCSKDTLQCLSAGDLFVPEFTATA